MSNVFEEMMQEKQAEQRGRLGEYYVLLASMNLNSPTAKEKLKLAGLMSALGKSAETVKKDHEAIVSIQRHIAHTADKESKEKQAVNAYEKYMAVCAERQETFLAMNERVTSAMTANEDAQNLMHQCNQSRGELIRLKECDPILHDAVVERRIK